ncbi:hypothetical protein ACVDG3_16945 [Meridianimarinicoccus sp. RP-17]|uniref:hypothetical protein n=1 Tax=Meridianimarinicoccus zhengii TaxID=2056810 RepID=UPI000DAC92B0|nr:hypothetical protein [Phycocomes zhengii]
MVRRSAPFLSVLLALVIALTAIHAGAMRGQAKAAGSIVLCTGTGPVSVAVDADGQPVGPVHVCPDCVMSLLAAVDAPSPVPHAAAPARRLSFAQAGVALRSRAVVGPRARGPPHPS